MIKWVLYTAVFGVISTRNLKAERTNTNKPKEGNVLIEHIDTCAMEKKLVRLGLVDIEEINSKIKVDLRYAGTNNFMGIKLYDCLHKAFVQKEVAVMLDSAYAILQKCNSGYTFLIWDAVRPVSIQQKMWDSLQMPLEEKGKYVANPQKRSMHNYGCAIDLTLLDSEGKLVDMGTTFDHFGVRANTDKDSLNLARGNLTLEQINNRKILSKCMHAAGFHGLKSEWWHFNGASRKKIKSGYLPIE